MNMRKWLQDSLQSEPRAAMPILSFPSAQLLGITVKELVGSSEQQAQGMAAIARRCPSAAAVSMMDLSVEAECFGAAIRFTDDEVPTVVGAVLQSPEDAQALTVPAVGSGRTGLYLDAISRALTLIQDRPVFAGVIGPFSLAGRLWDMTEIMINCYDEPEAVELTLEKVTAFLTDYILAYKARGAHGIVLAEPAAGLLSPELAEAFSCRYVKRIVDAVQDDSFLVIYHNCGPTVPNMVPALLAIGAAAYHFGNAIDLGEVIDRFPTEVPVMGNIDPVARFRNGTPEGMREAVLSLLQKLADRKNFLISSGCDIPPVSPWENIDAFFAAVGEYYESA